MRVAVVSDIHGNRTAFEAVIEDLRHVSPDLVLHGGDLADGGSSPAEIVDRVRELGWQSVIGNGDEMLAMPETLDEFADQQSPQLRPLLVLVREMASATRAALGEARLTWLRELPRIQIHGPMAPFMPAPRVHGAHRRRKRATTNWKRSTDRLASRLRSTGTSIARSCEEFHE
jgi:3',5'-cyclic AMP phosphodiesterase CpdA